MKNRDAFQRGKENYFLAKKQFEGWRGPAGNKAKSLLQASPRGRLIDLHHSIYVSNVKEDRLQVWFGSSGLGERSTPTGGIAIEKGATLLYSLGPVGKILVLLYPATSDCHSALEDHIVLEHKQMSAKRLDRVLKQHMRDLIAYHHATALDGETTLGERLRVWWLRQTSEVQIDGKPIVRAGGWAKWITERVTRAAIGSFFVPVAIVIVAAILAAFGWDFAQQMLTARLAGLAK